MEQPVIRKVNDKQDCLVYFEYQEILNADIKKDKYWLPMILPLLESQISTSLFPGYLEDEFARFKQEIGYELYVKKYMMI